MTSESGLTRRVGPCADAAGPGSSRNINLTIGRSSAAVGRVPTIVSDASDSVRQIGPPGRPAARCIPKFGRGRRGAAGRHPGRDGVMIMAWIDSASKGSLNL